MTGRASCATYYLHLLRSAALLVAKGSVLVNDRRGLANPFVMHDLHGQGIIVKR
jgi:hypothetical protein